MSDNKTLGDKVNSGMRWTLMFIPELAFYVPFDLFACPVRDRLIPYKTKKKWPPLACRGYMWARDPPKCKPAERYEHKWLFKCLCWNYDMETGECKKQGRGGKSTKK